MADRKQRRHTRRAPRNIMSDTPNGATRTERDSMGEMQVPAHALYGASTQRAVLNFPISDMRYPRRFIKALGQVKLAAAQTNGELGLIDRAIADAIVEAAQEVVDGKHDHHFVVDIFQTGSGTSTNMNANEVIAHIVQGHKRTDKKVHQNDHVNFGQSSNDVIPTATHIAAASAIKEDLLPALATLQSSLEKKSKEFWPIIKTGRTHLQDATPIRLGQEFLGYAGQIERGRKRVEQALAELTEIALGGTAVGTGINTHPDFAKRTAARLATMTGLPIHETTNHFQAQSSLDNCVAASGALKTVAVSLTKIANDLRWLGSGPRAGIGEIELPAVQPGSSIMPGKVNPVICESVLMVCVQVIGNDAAITVGGQSGNFEINLMMPIIAYDLLQSISLLAHASANLAKQCVDGLKATVKGPEMVERGLAICTSLAPIIGYDAAANLAKEAAKTGKTIREVAREQTKLSEAELDKILDPSLMCEPSADRVGAGGG
jgi:fumarate hydratase class II